MSFDDFFQDATGYVPFDYQISKIAGWLWIKD